MVPMAVVVAAVAVVVVSVPSAATATVSMMQTTKAGACPHGFYRAASGDICCQQCEAGEYLISDCTAEQGHSSCQVCDGGYFTEYPNSSPKCFTCTPCQPDEEEERQCSATTDRRCRCKPGYHKPVGDTFCRKESVPPVTSSTTAPPDSGGNRAGIAVPVVLLLLIVAAAAAVFIYKKKRGKFPWEKERGHYDQPDLTASPLLENNTQHHEAGPSTGQDGEPGSSDQQDPTASPLLENENSEDGPFADASGSAGHLLDGKPSASESDADSLESQTTTQPDGPDGGQHGGVDRGEQPMNNPQDGVTPTSGRRQDDSGSAGRLLDGKPSASESDADQRESQTTTQPGGPDGDQRGAADPNGHRLNDNEYVEGEPGNSNQQESTPLGLLNWKAPIPETGRSAEGEPGNSNQQESTPLGLLNWKAPIPETGRSAEGEPGNSNQQESASLGLLKEKAPIPETGPSAEVRDMDESMAAKLIRGKRPELKTWIGRDPTYLLDYLESRGLISREKYNEAKDINGKVERANFLINELIDRDECLKLWRALESLQDPYPQLKEWISACVSTTHHACEKAPGRDANVQYSTAPAGEVATKEKAFRRLTACSDEQLLDGIQKNMTSLVEAIQGDVQPLLTKLFEKGIFTIAEMNAVSTAQKNNGGSEAASQLITMLLHKGDRVAREFWMALSNLKTNYPRMHKIFENGI
ncbi:uncharacterized protein LOC133359535 isoform X2 [Lethenteron reissneri]|uniref:uncharacterized protein LOC133359535 isoform X2 n=1 Tax=Lethenteron reissneri TaxID=7753 RepID=UPI002AB6791F|nr:uncharacterized protein LOC133359535 isoform X2 [Lethenteron reissneri]